MESNKKEKIRQTVLKVSLAGLFHDVGKFAQGALPLSQKYREGNADLYQPYNPYQKRYTHEHALYTAAFIETLAEVLPSELNSPTWGEGDPFINLAAKHHRPETPLQWIVTQADRLSSGIDRAEFEKGEEIEIREYKSTRLLPLFERLLRQDKTFDQAEDYLWRYPLRPLSATSIFPVKVKSVSREEAEEEYRELFQGFLEDLRGLCHRDRVDLWAQHFDSLLRVYTSHIPAARVGKVIHDVSLYDHLRTTAALAGALYLYHRGTGTLDPEAIQDDSPRKFLLVSGDFYGIQDFIFRAGGEERHHRAKLLRGRSFLVSLLVELAAEMFCQKTGLSFLSVFFAAAGKFHLLAPNLEETREALRRTRERINRWLYEKFFGECALGFAATEASAEDFLGGRFQALWRRHLEGLEEAKYERFDLSRFGGAFGEHISPGYLDRFRNDLDHPLCPLCGRRPSDPEVLGDHYISRKDQEGKACACRLCRDQAFIGTHLVKGERMAVLRGGEGDLKEPLFGCYQLRFLRNDCSGYPNERNIIKFFDLNITENGSIPVEVSFLPLNGYVPRYTREDRLDRCLFAGEKGKDPEKELREAIKEGLPKTFHHLAQKSLFLKIKGDRRECYGVPALATLKADVDNLGAIFACGLPPELFTLSRLSTMSRQLHNFFTVYLPYALAREKEGAFRNIYTVFAGGDDLFLIGPWTEIRDLALFLRDKFRHYVCENPEIHFSAGISLHKPYTPVDLLAREAEEALSRAKKASKEKNRISMFGVVATWDDFRDLREIEEVLEDWYERECFSRRGLYRLNELVFLAAEEARWLEKGTIPQARLRCFRWPALLRYFLVRQLERAKGCPEEYETMVLDLARWLSRHRKRFILALWPLLYNTRKQRV